MYFLYILKNSKFWLKWKKIKKTKKEKQRNIFEKKNLNELVLVLNISDKIVIIFQNYLKEDIT